MSAVTIAAVPSLFARHVVIVLTVTAAVVVATRDVGYILSTPFWLDEAWVALSVRFPLTDLPALTSSTPIAWNAAQQLFAPFGEQAQRILPLIFTWLASAAAYFLGYVAWDQSRWRRVATGVVVSAAVTFLPSMLLRNDLKQYTADVFLALLVLGLAILVDRQRRRGPLVALTVISSVGMLVSLPVVFVSASAFAAALVAGLRVFEKTHVLRVIVGGAIAGASLLAIYLLVYREGSQGSLVGFWRDFYPTPTELPGYLLRRMGGLVDITSPGFLVVFAVLVFIGFAVVVFVSWRAKNFVPALHLVALAIIMCAVGVLEMYPLLDQRTSLFLTVSVYAIFVFSAVRLLFMLTDLVRSRRVRLSLAAGGIALGLALIAALGAPSVRSESINAQDARSQVEYIKSHSEPGDVIYTNLWGALSLAYYWPELESEWRAEPRWTIGFEVTFPGEFVVVDSPRDATTLEEFIVEWAEEPSGQSAWIISTHRGLDGLDTAKEEWPITEIDVGIESLHVLRSSALPVASEGSQP